MAFYKRNALLHEREPALEGGAPNDGLAGPTIIVPEARIESSVPVVKALAEPPYQNLFSSFIDQVLLHVESGNTLQIMQYPGRYWNSNMIEMVKWVSIRLRCLLENLIRLSNAPTITYETLRKLLKAFKEILASEYFHKLPLNYPYLTLFKGLVAKLSVLVKQGKYYQTLRFRFTTSKKAEVIAARFILAGLVPSVKFTDLNFKE